MRLALKLNLHIVELAQHGLWLYEKALRVALVGMMGDCEPEPETPSEQLRLF